MILGHRAPSSLNMSSYRAISTHFNSMFPDFLKKNQDLGTKILVPRSWYQDPGTKIFVPRSWYQDVGTRSLGEPVPG